MNELELDAERCRRGLDRRQRSIRTFFIGSYHARRRDIRRTGDQHSHYIDWYEPHLLVAALTIMVLSIADAFLTLKLLNYGAVEKNAIMAVLIEKDYGLFTAVKFMLTGFSLLVLVAHFNFRVFKHFKVTHFLSAFALIYVALFTYELVLFQSLPFIASY